MSKLKDKIIHLFGGLTEEDAIVRTKPLLSSYEFSVFKAQTLRAQHIVKPEVIKRYPEYMDRVYGELTYRIADMMLENRLVEFASKNENSEDIVVTATARVFRPEV